MALSDRTDSAPEIVELVGLRNHGDGADPGGLSLLPAVFCQGIAERRC
jgi:hypothetical protein